MRLEREGDRKRESTHCNDNRHRNPVFTKVKSYCALSTELCKG